MTKLINQAYDIYLRVLQALEAPALFAIRLLWGTLFVMEGYGKFADIPSNASYFVSLGFSHPELMVYISASAEFFGGLCMLFGLFSRIAAVPLIITMVVAAIMDPSKHVFLGSPGTDPTEGFLSQIPLVFAYMAAVTMFCGAGKWSLDYLLRNKFRLCR